MVCGRVPGSIVVVVDGIVVVDVLVVVVDGAAEVVLLVLTFLTDLVVVGKLGGAVSPQLDKMMAVMGRSSFALFMPIVLRLLVGM